MWRIANALMNLHHPFLTTIAKQNRNKTNKEYKVGIDKYQQLLYADSPWNLFTTFIPSEIACFANYPGRIRRTAV